MTSRALINPLPKNSGVSLRATIQNPRPRKYASDADRQKAFRERQAVIQVRVKPETVETFDRIASTLGYSRQEVVYALLMSGLNNNRNWQQTGIPAFRLPRYEENPTMRKATPAQLAARERFAEMARSGAFKRKAKAAPKRKKNPISYGLDGVVNITDTYERSVASSRGLAEHYANQLRMRGRDDIVYVVFGITPEAKKQAGRYKNGVTITLDPRNYEIAYAFHPTQGEISRQLKAQRDAERRAYARERIGRMPNPTKKTVSQKISQLVREGYPQPQAVAIALSEERKGKVKKNPLGVSGGRYEIRRLDKSNAIDSVYTTLTHAKSAIDEIDRPAGSFYIVDTETGKHYFSFQAETKYPHIEIRGTAMQKAYDRNPVEAKERKPRVVLITNPKQRMGLIAFRTAGGALTTKEVPILFSFKLPVAANLYGEKSMMDFFAHKDGQEIAVTEKTTGFKLGNIPRVFMAVGRDEKAAAKYFVEDLLKKHGAPKLRAAVESKPKIA